MIHTLSNIILLKEKGGMKESIPRQVDKKSGSPRRRKGSGVLKEEIGVWNSPEGGKDKLFFPSTFLNLSHIKRLFFFKPGNDDYPAYLTYMQRTS